ncbi:protein phosphatase 2C domain-containing protein [Actinomycetospora endophytica]|uniref:Protein phosphatase 2C domain-containing protein n=1 Tax=Actinomycetospora endophytica TaxID=2291215 RepID=A0ABS8P7T9_9PSEU|nr:protein phosphatase 2C domain-containing protein [Actinomycetospora endophytica]MCD2193610.1 protein phosphatase 2C domain-containing protein [Actinomycetospora endophytica]
MVESPATSRETNPAEPGVAPPPDTVALAAPLDAARGDGPARAVAPAAARAPYVVGDPGRAAGQVRPAPDLRFPERPDTTVDGYTVAGPDGRPSVELRAAGVRGLAHRYYGTVRQDSAAVRVSVDQRWLVAVVADGVSAGEHSHVAADTAATAAATELAGLLGGTAPEAIDWPALFLRLADQVAHATRVHLAGHGIHTDGELTDLAAQAATTVLIAVLALASDPDGTRELHLIGLGDTSAWTLDDSGWSCHYGAKTHQLYASSATAALPILPPEPPRPARTQLGRGQVLALVTDGIGDPLGDGTGEVGAFLAARWQAPPTPLEFAAQVDFARRSYDDDRTAIVLWPEETP